MINWIKRSYEKQIDGTGLAVFRILYSIVLLCEIATIFYFRHLIFDEIPYIKTYVIRFEIPLIIWFISVVFILFGLFTRGAAIINYILTLVFISTMILFEYHVFYIYLGINFILIFLPVSNCLSLDRLKTKLKYSNTKFQYKPLKEVPQLSYYVVALVAIGFVYFDSIFFKFTSETWVKGLGMWSPSSLPMITYSDTSFIMNQEYLVKFLGYLVIAFELAFIFTFFIKKFRWLIFIIGMGLHLGILIEYPIPWFALAVCAIYFVIIPVGIWKKIKIKQGHETLTFYYDQECPLCVRTKIIINHFDIFNKIEFKTVQNNAEEEPLLNDYTHDQLLDNIFSISKKGKVFQGVDTYIQVLSNMIYTKPISWILRIPGIYHIAKKVYNYVAVNRTTERCTEDNCGYTPPVVPVPDSKVKLLENLTLKDLKLRLVTFGIILITIFQLIVSYESFVRITHIENKVITKIFELIPPIRFVSAKFLGITNHPVFTYSKHFKGYNHVIAVTYENNGKETFLPIIDEKGQPNFYITGANWVNWTFRVNGPNISMKNLKEGIQRYTAFWAGKNHIDLNDAKFNVKVKKINVCPDWKYDHLRKQISNEWIDGGYVQWEGGKYIPYIKDIETL